MRTSEVPFVEFECLLFGTFSGIGHVALAWFLHSENISDCATADEYLPEELPAILVLKAVDGENFLAVNIGKTQNLLNLVKAFLKL